MSVRKDFNGVLVYVLDSSEELDRMDIPSLKDIPGNRRSLRLGELSEGKYDVVHVTYWEKSNPAFSPVLRGFSKKQLLDEFGNFHVGRTVDYVVARPNQGVVN